MFKLIHIENKVDVKEMYEVLKRKEFDTAVIILTSLKRQYSDGYSFRADSKIQEISNLFGVDLNLIR